MARAPLAEHRAARHPVGFLGTSRQALTRLVLVFTTSPWTASPGLSVALVDHIAGLRLSGWIIRQAHQRNYLLWRNGLRQDLSPPILVLPRFSERAPKRVVTVLVLADLLAAERRASPATFSRAERHLALSLDETGLDPQAVAALADALLMRAAETSWLL